MFRPPRMSWERRCSHTLPQLVVTNLERSGCETRRRMTATSLLSTVSTRTADSDTLCRRRLGPLSEELRHEPVRFGEALDLDGGRVHDLLDPLQALHDLVVGHASHLQLASFGDVLRDQFHRGDDDRAAADDSEDGNEKYDFMLHGDFVR